jgi:hypothetical protein
VHAAAQPPVETGAASEGLRRHAVHEEVDRLLFEVVVREPLTDDAPDRAVRPRLQFGVEAVGRRLGDRGESLGDDLAVTAMAAEHLVGDAE